MGVRCDQDNRRCTAAAVSDPGVGNDDGNPSLGGVCQLEMDRCRRTREALQGHAVRRPGLTRGNTRLQGDAKFAGLSARPHRHHDPGLIERCVPLLWDPQGLAEATYLGEWVGDY